MKVTKTKSQWTASNIYENNFVTVQIPKEKEGRPWMVMTVGKIEAAMVQITRAEAANILKKMRK